MNTGEASIEWLFSEQLKVDALPPIPWSAERIL